MKYPLILILTIFLFAGCSQQKMIYDRSFIAKKFTDNYTILLNQDTIEFDYCYLDKNNIDKVILYPSSKTIQVFQKDTTTSWLPSLETFKGLEKHPLDTIGSLVINGLLIPKENYNSLKLEASAVEEVQVITEKEKSSSFCFTLMSST